MKMVLIIARTRLIAKLQSSYPGNESFAFLILRTIVGEIFPNVFCGSSEMQMQA